MEKYTVEHIAEVIDKSEEEFREIYLNKISEDVGNSKTLSEILGKLSYLDKSYIMTIIVRSLHVLLNEDNDCVEE